MDRSLKMGQETAVLTVHHLNKSQSERIVWLCEELELPYELKRYHRDESGAAPVEYKALHPSGTAPVVSDGDTVLAESGAIVEYICARHGGGRLLLAPENPRFAQFLYWFHFANGSMMPAFMMEIVAKRLGSPPVNDRLDKAYDLAELRLSEAEWFAGEEFTAADVMMVFAITVAARFQKRDISGYPNIRAYLERATARPAFRAAMAKAEPDGAA